MEMVLSAEGTNPGVDGEAVVFPVVEGFQVEEEVLVAVVHPVDGSWSRSIGVLLSLLFFLATGSVFAQPQNEVSGSNPEGEDNQLCYLNESGTVPDDVKFDEQDLSVKRALEKLDFVQRDIVNQMGKYRTKAERNKCRYPDCIAGVAWETLNMGAPNALSTAKGVILKLEALYLRERMKNRGADADKIAFETSRQAYCNFIATQAYVD